MDLSIVAVAINNLEVTKRFVSSIRQFTGGDYELILIDNGSTDKKATSFFRKSADIFYRFSKRADLAKAWNKGIELSKGKYVAVVNNDTIVPPYWFGPLKETLAKNEKVGMVSPLTFNLIKGYFEHGNLKGIIKNFFEMPNNPKPFKGEKFKEVIWGEFCVFKRKALQDVNGFCEKYKVASGEDLEMCFQLYSKGYDLYVDPRVFVYHQGGASQTKDIIKTKFKDKAWDDNFELFKSRWPKYTKGWK